MEHQYAEISMEIEAARLLTYNAARLKKNQIIHLLKKQPWPNFYASMCSRENCIKCINGRVESDSS